MKVHFIGIGGIGVSGLAGYYLSRGYRVSGSDLDNSPTVKSLRKRGAKIYTPHQNKFGAVQVGHFAGNIAQDVELVIYSAAVPQNNPELKKADKLGIKCQTYAQALGDLTKQMFTIAVSGMHGKSTTTAMLALVLQKAGLDPTVIVGTKLREWGNLNYRVGKSKYLVIEADEYKASFLNYWPKIIVLTNIEEEHLDYYKNLNHIMAMFRKYVSHLGEDGILVANSDDTNISNLKSQISKPQLKVKNYSVNQLVAGEVRKILQVPGAHNISNALAVLAVARTLNIPDRIIFQALANFKGTWRRMEYRGVVNGAKIYDDYGHHPTEIKATLQGAREMLITNLVTSSQSLVPKLWLVFQPHQYQRTYKLFDQFVTAFGNADKAVLLPIYSVPGRERDSIKKKVSSGMLTEKIAKRNQELGIRNQEILYLNSFPKAKNYLKKNLKKGDVCIIMGAGDVIKLTETLLK